MLKYEQIQRELIQSITEGGLRPGQRLPSIREACSRFDCNKATVIRAYQELEAQHYVTARNKSGYYVLDNRPPEKGQSPSHLDFAAVELQKEFIPYEDFQHCINNAIEKEKANLFCYTKSAGLGGLIRQIRKEMMKQQVFANEQNIVITSGIQQAISLLSQMPFYCCRESVMVEQPTFRGVLYALKHAGIETIGVERTYEGLDLCRVEHLFRTGRIKFFYVQPRYHNPLGTHLPEEQKKALVALARQYDVYLVEDDYMCDFDPVKSRDPLAAGNLDRVIYLRSFSKILVPGIRVGAAVLPDALLSTFVEHKTWADISTSILTQGALEVYLRSGLMDRHVPSIRKVYQERMSVARALLEQRCPYPWFVPDNGLFLSVELPKSISIQKLVSDLQPKGIVLQSNKEHFLESFRHRQVLRITVSNVTPDQIRAGLPVILNALEGAVNQESTVQWL